MIKIDWSRIQTNNHLAGKRTHNSLAKLAKYEMFFYELTVCFSFYLFYLFSIYITLAIKIYNYSIP